MKIAHFSPLPPQSSGIADYCAQLLPYLADLVEVDVYATAVSPTTPFPVRPIDQFLNSPAKRYEYDICLYHMGNHPAYHEDIYQAMLRYPGIAILHDVNLHAYYRQRLTADRDAAYVREMGYAYGRSGINAARQSLAGMQPPDIENQPLFQRVAASSLGVIVHTEFARRALATAVSPQRIAHIPLGAELPEPVSQPAWRTNFPPDAVAIGSFGHIAASKRIEIVLPALARLRDSGLKFHYLIVGESIPGYDVTAVINQHNLGDIVQQTGRVAPDAFQSYLGGIDIGVNLRTGPTGGEMSATLVHLLAHGQPTLVSDVGGFADLPDNCVMKIAQDEQEVDAIAAALRQLIQDAALRARYGQAARRFAAEQYAFPQVARRYVAFVRSCLATAVPPKCS